MSDALNTDRLSTIYNIIGQERYSILIDQLPEYFNQLSTKTKNEFFRHIEHEVIWTNNYDPISLIHMAIEKTGIKLSI